MLDGYRVALVLPANIGDVVHGLPLAASLKYGVPGIRLEWFVHPVPAALVEPHPGVDRTRIIERRKRRGFRDLARSLRGERFDLVIVPWVFGDASLVAHLIDAPLKLGFDRALTWDLDWRGTNARSPARPPSHLREQFLQFADRLGVPRRYEWDLPLSATERDARDRFLATCDGPPAALVVGTSGRLKEWPVERWARLAETLHHDRGYDVCLVGGLARRENALAAAIREAARCPIRDERRDDLRRLVWLLDGAAIAISLDTGPYHLAVALDTPTIGLFGASDPARYGPGRRFAELVVDGFHDPGEAWCPRARRWRDRMERIGADRVLAAVDLARARYPRAVEGPAFSPR